MLDNSRGCKRIWEDSNKIYNLLTEEFHWPVSSASFVQFHIFACIQTKPCLPYYFCFYYLESLKAGLSMSSPWVFSQVVDLTQYLTLYYSQ